MRISLKNHTVMTLFPKGNATARLEELAVWVDSQHFRDLAHQFGWPSEDWLTVIKLMAATKRPQQTHQPESNPQAESNPQPVYETFQFEVDL